MILLLILQMNMNIEIDGVVIGSTEYPIDWKQGGGTLYIDGLVPETIFKDGFEENEDV